jgi:7-cyano-7-deazaguanine synthase
MFYGQRHAKEIQAARAVASHYQVAHIEMDLSQIFKFGDVSALMSNSKIPLPSGAYRSDGVQSTYVPFRNGLFLSTAAALALQLNCEAVYYGAHADDAAGNAYPDCSKEFAYHMGAAVFEGTGGKVLMEAPFASITKADVVAKGLALEVPFHLTWSCYAGGEKPCGQCATCIDRAKAFAINGLTEL